MNNSNKEERKITQKSLFEKNLRKCIYTGKILPLSEFKLMKNGKYDSLSSEGRRLYQQEYREKNPERKKMHDKNYREKLRVKRHQNASNNSAN